MINPLAVINTEQIGQGVIIHPLPRYQALLGNAYQPSSAWQSMSGV